MSCESSVSDISESLLTTSTRSGSVCLDVINQTWSPMYDMINIFEVFLPQLLRYPNPSDPLNGEAAALMMREPKGYEAKVKGMYRLRLVSMYITANRCTQNTLPNTLAKKQWTRRARTPSPKTNSAQRAATNLAVKNLPVQWTTSKRLVCCQPLGHIGFARTYCIPQVFLISLLPMGAGSAGVSFIVEFPISPLFFFGSRCSSAFAMLINGVRNGSCW